MYGISGYIIIYSTTPAPGACCCLLLMPVRKFLMVSGSNFQVIAMLQNLKAIKWIPDGILVVDKNLKTI